MGVIPRFVRPTNHTGVVYEVKHPPKSLREGEVGQQVV